MEGLLNVLRHVGVAFFGALLPSPERDEVGRNTMIDVALASCLIGVAQFLLGSLAFLSDGIAFVSHLADVNAAALMKMDPNKFTDDAKKAYMLSGSLNWLIWITQPWTWFLAYFPLMGLVRMTSFAVTREGVGEPWVTVPLRLAQALRRKALGARQAAKVGPSRPDRFLREPGSDLVLLTCRLLPDWQPAATLDVDGTFYRLVRMEERRSGAWVDYAYVLREEDSNEVIRSLVRYEPP